MDCPGATDRVVFEGGVSLSLPRIFGRTRGAFSTLGLAVAGQDPGYEYFDTFVA